MAEHKPLCTWSRSEASRCGELDFWRESNKENHCCARAIEESIRLNFSGMHLNADCAKHVIEAFGFDRVNWVLANTIQEKAHDGRFSASNKEWAKSFHIPKDESNCFFCVESHPAVLDGFIDQARKAWQDLGLFDISHCEPEADGEINYSGKVVVIDPHQLKDAYKTADDQLFLATGGFGCAPNSRGRKVFGEFLKDGEKTYYFRSDILGVLKSEYLPQWAFEKLNPDTVMDATYEPASDAPAMTGM